MIDVSQQTTTTAAASSAMSDELMDADDGSSLSSVSFTNDGVTAKMSNMPSVGVGQTIVPIRSSLHVLVAVAVISYFQQLEDELTPFQTSVLQSSVSLRLTF